MLARRVIAFGVALAGGLLALYSLAEYAGGSIPFQDPTSAMLLQQQAELRSAGIRAVVGVALLLLGSVVALIRREP